MGLYTPIRLGIDLDGCLAQFDLPFANVLIEVSGRDLFGCPTREFVPQQWGWPKALGYTEQEINKAWRAVKESKTFWMQVQPYPDAADFLDWLAKLPDEIETYFITSRVGETARGQTAVWLRAAGYLTRPYVVMARGQKGYLTHGIGITHMIDDYPPNCISARDFGCPHVYLLDRPWNQNLRLEEQRGMTRIASLQQFREDVDQAIRLRGDGK